MTAWNGREPHYRRHPSEKLVMDRLGRRYNRVPPNIVRQKLVRLGTLAASMLLLWAMILAWAVSLVR